MKTNRLTYAQRYQLICECKASGLSDSQWCIEHGIKPSTFYNWYARLRAKGYTDFPESARYAGPNDSFQEVVKLDVINPDATLPALPTNTIEQSDAITNKHMAIEISIGNATIKISNDVNPVLLKSLIEGLGGVSC